jgi:alkylhydroperoxidase/carboxymuconolactone decarboxylase family protein YurZ
LGPRQWSRTAWTAARIGAKTVAIGGDSPMSGESSRAELLRRLALNDDRVLTSVLSASATDFENIDLSGKSRALFQIAALVAAESSLASYKWAVSVAQSEGASDDEIISVLVSVAPVVGSARVTVAAPVLATALGYEIDMGE